MWIGIPPENSSVRIKDHQYSSSTMTVGDNKEKKSHPDNKITSS
jgi:hypothetical protein